MNSRAHQPGIRRSSGLTPTSSYSHSLALSVGSSVRHNLIDEKHSQPIQALTQDRAMSEPCALTEDGKGGARIEYGGGARIIKTQTRNAIVTTQNHWRLPTYYFSSVRDVVIRKSNETRQELCLQTEM